MLAHELRNPLAAIRGALEVLRLGSADSAEAVKMWGIVDRQARQMVRLTDDLLDASRITRGAITLRKEEVNLGTVVAHAVETARTLIDERRHWIEPFRGDMQKTPTWFRGSVRSPDVGLHPDCPRSGTE